MSAASDLAVAALGGLEPIGAILARVLARMPRPDADRTTRRANDGEARE